MVTEPDSTKLNPAALAVEHAARVLTGAGGKPITMEMIRSDLDAGAPQNPGGTVNLVEYAAWMVKEMGRGE